MTAQSKFDIQSYLQSLPGKPGVYRMFDDKQNVIYVGKAKDLKKRVSSYFRDAKQLAPKNRVMVGLIAGIEVTITHTEAEALILESNLIKELLPRYNILLRDDKSYPYIYVSTEQNFPRIKIQRGARKGKGRYFGPFPSAGAVRTTLNLLQKLFLIRQCDDSYFQNRSRPCLQHQIDRCTAPCVELITKESYAQDIQHVILFLEGRSQEVIDLLVGRMENAAEKLHFELAARLRDQIASLQRIQQKQYVSSKSADVDVIACLSRNGVGCVSVYFIRDGLGLGNKTYFPQHTKGATAIDILSAFLPQFYLNGPNDRKPPPNIIINQALPNIGLLKDVLSNRATRKVHISHGVRSERARWLELCCNNAELALNQRLTSSEDALKRILALQSALDMEEKINRIECFDISHTMGEATVASCVVFGAEGALKSDYRRFNISGITPGDDFAAMFQALKRRYGRIKKEQGRMPELLLIDGGSGQVAQARSVLEDLQIDSVTIVGVAKGPTRKAGLETLLLSDGVSEISLASDAPALHLMQQIRDEAHRFAIAGHRQQRAKKRRTSSLEGIEGIGSKRRKQLLQHFGGLQGISSAGVEDLSRISGISNTMAQRIYDHFHSDS